MLILNSVGLLSVRNTVKSVGVLNLAVESGMV